MIFDDVRVMVMIRFLQLRLARKRIAELETTIHRMQEDEDERIRNIQIPTYKS